MVAGVSRSADAVQVVLRFNLEAFQARHSYHGRHTPLTTSKYSTFRTLSWRLCTLPMVCSLPRNLLSCPACTYLLLRHHAFRPLGQASRVQYALTVPHHFTLGVSRVTQPPVKYPTHNYTVLMWAAAQNSHSQRAPRHIPENAFTQTKRIRVSGSSAAEVREPETYLNGKICFGVPDWDRTSDTPEYILESHFQVPLRVCGESIVARNANAVDNDKGVPHFTMQIFLKTIQ